MKDQNGVVQPGKQVTITVNVQDGTGGHIHAENRPKGIFTCGLMGSPWTCTLTTDNSGQAPFEFVATPISGTHTLTATCAGCSNTATKTVDVKVEGLWQILDSEYYALIEDGSTKVIGSKDNHKSNHYLNSASQLQLWNLAQEFYEFQVQNGVTSPTLLHLNDASLKWGGIFDIDADWVPDHFEHRRGSVVDIRANSSPGAIPLGLTKDFERIANDLGIDPHLEYENDSIRRHFHTRLLNRRE